MSGLRLDQIPNNINTLERLTAWGMVTLAITNPKVSFLEDPETNVRVIQSGIIQAGDNTIRLLNRAAFELDSNYAVSPRQLWMAVKEISDTQIPADFLRS